MYAADSVLTMSKFNSFFPLSHKSYLIQTQRNDVGGEEEEGKQTPQTDERTLTADSRNYFLEIHCQRRGDRVYILLSLSLEKKVQGESKGNLLILSKPTNKNKSHLFTGFYFSLLQF